MRYKSESDKLKMLYQIVAPEFRPSVKAAIKALEVPQRTVAKVCYTVDEINKYGFHKAYEEACERIARLLDVEPLLPYEVDMTYNGSGMITFSASRNPTDEEKWILDHFGHNVYDKGKVKDYWSAIQEEFNDDDH